MDHRALRRTLGCFPTGVAVVTTVDAQHRRAGVTVNSFAPVSLHPALVLWSLDRSALSLAVFRAATGFTINVLSAGQRELSARFARGGTNKWHGVDTAAAPGRYPVLPGAVAVLDCETTSQIDGGDHIIFLGQVLDMRCDPDKPPLVFHRGQYRDLRPIHTELPHNGHA